MDERFENEFDIDSDIKLIKEVNKGSSVSNIAFHSRWPILANGSYSDFQDRSVQFFNVPKLEKVGSIEWGAQKVNCVAFHPRLNAMLTGDSNDKNNVKLWYVTAHPSDNDNYKFSAIELMTLGGHTNVITCIAFHSKQPFFATGSWDKQVKIWHYNENDWHATNCILTINLNSNVTSIAFHPTQHIIATASRGSGAKMFDFSDAAAATGIDTTRIIEHDITLGEHIDTTCVAFHPGPINFILAVGGHANDVETGRTIYSIKLWDYSSIDNPICVATLTEHRQKINSMIFHPLIPLLVSGSDDGTVNFWCIEDDITKTKCYYTIQYSLYGINIVTSIAICPHNNSLLATGTFNGMLRLYNISELMSKLTKRNPFYIKPCNPDTHIFCREFRGNGKTPQIKRGGGNNKNRNTKRNRHKLSRKRNSRTFRKKRKSHNRRYVSST